MQSIRSTGSDSSLENQWDDSIAVDHDTNECWTQPWDLPARVNCADHSDVSESGARRNDVTATSASKDNPAEVLNSKGCCSCILFYFV